MVRVVMAVVLSGLACLGACSGKAVDGDDDGQTQKAPAQLCRDYASTWCNKFFGCYVKVGRMKEADKQRNISECFSKIDQRLPCADVQSVSEDFDKCLSQVEGMSCSKFDLPQAQVASIKPPASCEDAMSFD